MKALLYGETKKGNKIIVAIGDANIDPLETRNAAIEHAQGLPKFGELQARIKTYNDFVEKCRAEGVKLGDPGSIPSHIAADLRNRMSIITGLQDDLKAEQKRFETEKPIYMVPASSLLIDDQTAEDIESVTLEGQVIILRTDRDGAYMGFEIIDDMRGVKYRLRNSLNWTVIQEPDEALPENAMLTAPTDDELKVIDGDRIKALSPEDREKEKAAVIKQSEMQYSLDVIAADLKGTAEEIRAAKDQARTDHDARVLEIEQLYI